MVQEIIITVTNQIITIETTQETEIPVVTTVAEGTISIEAVVLRRALSLQPLRNISSEAMLCLIRFRAHWKACNQCEIYAEPELTKAILP